MPAPIPEIATDRPEPAHGEEVVRDLVELLRRHVRLDGAHFSIAAAGQPEGAAAVVGERYQRAETIAGELVRVRERLLDLGLPLRHFPTLKLRDCLIPSDRDRAAVRPDKLLSGASPTATRRDQSRYRRIGDNALPVRLDLCRGTVAAIVANRGCWPRRSAGPLELLVVPDVVILVGILLGDDEEHRPL